MIYIWWWMEDLGVSISGWMIQYISIWIRVFGWMIHNGNDSSWIIVYLVGGWPTPLNNMKVSWDDYSQYIYIWKITNVPNQQPDTFQFDWTKDRTWSKDEICVNMFFWFLNWSSNIEPTKDGIWSYKPGIQIWLSTPHNKYGLSYR